MVELKFTFTKWLSKNKLFTNLEKVDGYWQSVLDNLKDLGIKEVFVIPNPRKSYEKEAQICNIANIDYYDTANVLKLEMAKKPSIALIDYLLNLKPDRAWETTKGELCLLFYDRE